MFNHIILLNHEAAAEYLHDSFLDFHRRHEFQLAVAVWCGRVIADRASSVVWRIKKVGYNPNVGKGGSLLYGPYCLARGGCADCRGDPASCDLQMHGTFHMSYLVK